MEDSTVEFDFAVESADIDLEIRYARMLGEAKFIGSVRKDGWVAHVLGSSTVIVERTCDRCLKKVETEVGFSVDCAYVKYTMLNEKRETKLDMMRLDYSVIESTELNLKAIFNEQLLIAMPDMFVCAEDCKGLCPGCGEILDSAECKCKKEVFDPRWAALKDLK